MERIGIYDLIVYLLLADGTIIITSAFYIRDYAVELSTYTTEYLFTHIYVLLNLT